MGQVNIYLKRSFIGVIGVIMVISFLLLGSTLFFHGNIHYTDKAEGVIGDLHVLYGFSTAVLVLAIFGGFGSLKKKKWALIVFAVGMILAVLFFVVLEVFYQVIKPELEQRIRSYYLHMLPLDNAFQHDLENINHIQRNLRCCGIDKGYMDWKNNISQSCLCDSMSTNPCVPATKGSYQFTLEGSTKGQPVLIYSKPCLPLLIADHMHHIHLGSGIRFGFILLWMLAIGLCIAILCQMNRKLETPAVVYSKQARDGNYSFLVESNDA